MDQNMTLEKRIAAELYSYQGKMSVFVDDLQGHTVEMGADEEFETASTIKAYILAVFTGQPGQGQPDRGDRVSTGALCGRLRNAAGSGRGSKAQGERHGHHDDHLLR